MQSLIAGIISRSQQELSYTSVVSHRVNWYHEEEAITTRGHQMALACKDYEAGGSHHWVVS